MKVITDRTPLYEEVKLEIKGEECYSFRWGEFSYEVRRISSCKAEIIAKVDDEVVSSRVVKESETFNQKLLKPAVDEKVLILVIDSNYVTIDTVFK